MLWFAYFHIKSKPHLGAVWMHLWGKSYVLPSLSPYWWVGHHCRDSERKGNYKRFLVREPEDHKPGHEPRDDKPHPKTIPERRCQIMKGLVVYLFIFSFSSLRLSLTIFQCIPLSLPAKLFSSYEAHTCNGSHSLHLNISNSWNIYNRTNLTFWHLWY